MANDGFEGFDPSRAIAPSGGDGFEGFDPSRSIPAPKPSGIMRRALADTVVSGVKGAIGLPQALVGLADIPTLGYAGKAVEAAGVDFKRAQDIAETYYSPEQQAANRSVMEAKGFLPTLAELAHNPSVIAHQIVQNAPTMLGGGALSRGAATMLPAALGKYAPVVAGAIGEGAVTAGQNLEQVRSEEPSGLVTPGQVGLMAGSGALTGLIAGGVGAGAMKLGVIDPQTLMATGFSRKGLAAATVAAADKPPPGLIKRVVGGALSEGLLQEAPQSYQEQVAQNLAQGKPWDEGAGQAAALGAVVGGVMGGGTNIFASAPSLADEGEAARQQRLGVPPGTPPAPPAPPVGGVPPMYVPPAPTPATKPPEPPEPPVVPAAEVLDRAQTRLAELNLISKGSPDTPVMVDGVPQMIPGTQQPLVNPGTSPRYFTPLEQYQYTFLKANATDPVALARGFGVSLTPEDAITARQTTEKADLASKAPPSGVLTPIAITAIDTGAADKARGIDLGSQTAQADAAALEEQQRLEEQRKKEWGTEQKAGQKVVETAQKGAAKLRAADRADALKSIETTEPLTPVLARKHVKSLQDLIDEQARQIDSLVASGDPATVADAERLGDENVQLKEAQAKLLERAKGKSAVPETLSVDKVTGRRGELAVESQPPTEEQSALQIADSGRVLQREPGQVGEAGSERGRVEQGVQGKGQQPAGAGVAGIVGATIPEAKGEAGRVQPQVMQELQARFLREKGYPADASQVPEADRTKLQGEWAEWYKTERPASGGTVATRQGGGAAATPEVGARAESTTQITRTRPEQVSEAVPNAEQRPPSSLAESQAPVTSEPGDRGVAPTEGAAVAATETSERALQVSETPEPKQEFNSTQVALPAPFAKEVKAAAKSIIKDEDIDPEHGLEDRPHVTVKYGLHNNDPEAVRALVENEPPVTGKVEKLEVFSPEGKDYDVLVARVDSPDLHRLNAKIADALPHTDTFPEYKPHITLGYVKRGEGQKYADAKTDLIGKTFKIDSLEFSDQDEKVTSIPLKGETKQAIPETKPAIPETKAPAVETIAKIPETMASVPGTRTEGRPEGAAKSGAPDWMDSYTVIGKDGSYRVAGLRNLNPFSPSFATEREAQQWASDFHDQKVAEGTPEAGPKTATVSGTNVPLTYEKTGNEPVPGAAPEQAAQPTLAPVAQPPSKEVMTAGEASALANNSIPFGKMAGDRRAMVKQQTNIIAGLVKAGLKEREAKAIIEETLTRQASSNRGGTLMFLQANHLRDALNARGLLREAQPAPQPETKPAESQDKGAYLATLSDKQVADALKSLGRRVSPSRIEGEIALKNFPIEQIKAAVESTATSEPEPAKPEKPVVLTQADTEAIDRADQSIIEELSKSEILNGDFSGGERSRFDLSWPKLYHEAVSARAKSGELPLVRAARMHADIDTETVAKAMGDTLWYMLEQKAKAEPKVKPQESANIDGWKAADLREIRAKVEDGQKVFLGGNKLGLPEFQSLPKLEHMGYGMFVSRTPEYEVHVDGGGAMSKTKESGQSYTVATEKRGTLPYDKAGVLTAIDKALATIEPVRTPKPVTPQIPAIPGTAPFGVKTERPVPQPATTIRPTEAKADPFANNTLFTADAVAAARARIKSKMGRLSSGIDPEMMQDGMTIAGAYIEAGVRGFADYSAKMIADFGEAIRPYLRTFYEGVRHWPGLDTKGMTSSADIEKEIANGPSPVSKPSEGNGPAENAGPVPGDVQRPEGERETGGRPETEGGGVSGNANVEPGSTGRENIEPEPGAPLGQESDAPRAGTPAGDRGGALSGAGVSGRRPIPRGIDDYRPAPGAIAREGSWKATANRNLDALELIHKLEAEKRYATPAEQTILAKFTGWGASELRNKLFVTRQNWETKKPNLEPDLADDDWKATVQRAKDLMTQEELDTALQSTQYAHFTGEDVVRPIWAALDRMGFKSGRIFEPGMGTGNFVMLAPKSVMAHSTYSGIEREKLTAAIAKMLSPRQNITEGDFTTAQYPDGYFDIVIGNPPFGKTIIYSDPAYKRLGFALHDFFIAKSLDKLRPGGLMVLITSRYTMDKATDKARTYIGDRADLVGAIRLPQTAFKKNAGTEVVTDILIFRKREEGADKGGQAFQNLASVETPEGPTLINEYFAAHPEMVLGTHSLTGKMRAGAAGKEYTVLPLEKPIAEAFADAISKLPENIYAKRVAPTTERKAFERDMNPKAEKEGGIYLGDDGNLYKRERGAGRRLEELKNLTPAKQEWLKSAIKLRDLFKQARYDQLTNGQWEKSLKALDRAHTAFTKKHGSILEFTERSKTVVDEDGEERVEITRHHKNASLWSLDVEGVLLTGLEHIDSNGKIVKGSFLKGRSLHILPAPKIESAHDAMLVSLSDRGHLDIAHIAELSKSTPEQVIADLGDAIYQNPAGGQWETADSYLSGDVRQKLEEARVAAEVEPLYERNVDALYKAQPAPLAANQITVNLGSPWLPPSDIYAFASEIMGINVVPTMNQALGTWDVPGATMRSYRKDTNPWATPDRSAYEILDAALNNQTIKVRTPPDAQNRTQLDPVATTAANQKVKDLKSAFSRWVWTDVNRAGRLIEDYNKRFNNIANRVFDGSFLRLPGLSLHWQKALHPHQLRAIWRQIQTGNVYLAHAVGGGKTMEMIVGGMEQRRLGLIQKPIYVVPNHMLNQFASEFLDAYPGADIMVADEEQFHKDRRRQFVASAAANNPDAIIITHSAFRKIKPPPSATATVLNRLVDELRTAMDELEKDDRRTRSQIEARIEQLEQSFGGRGGPTDDVLDLAEMGVDYMYVDEAHMYRKLDFVTNLNNIKGINSTGSQQALDMYIKVKALEDLRKGRSHTFASGTAITNTIGEMYSVQRMMDEDALYRDGLQSFDAWASQFGIVDKFDERNAAGNYEVVERFAKFVNVADMMARVRQFMDVVTTSQLGELVQRPDVRGGKPDIVITPMSPESAAYHKELDARIRITRAWKPSPTEKGPPDPLINIITDARLANIDMRYVNPRSPNDPNSKLNKMLDAVIAKNNELKDTVYVDPITGMPDAIRGGGQIIFSALGFGEKVMQTRGFDVRGFIMQRLKAGGIPASQVAWMMDYDSHAKKEAMYREMREGKIKILIGSPKNMGTGLNVQRRLAELHFLSPPWYPADVEQPQGRILRQGNLNKEIGMQWYATEKSYDSTQWGMLARKGRFIEQALTGDKNVRELDDISESSLYEQAAAEASGDQRAIEYSRLSQAIETLENLQRAHAEEQYGFQRERDQLNYNNRALEGQIENYKKAVEAGGGEYIPSSTATATIKGAKHEKFSNIGAAIYAEAQRLVLAWKPVNMKDTATVPIGTVGDSEHQHKINIDLYAYSMGDGKPHVGARFVVTVGPVQQAGNSLSFEPAPTAQEQTGIASKAFNDIYDIQRSLDSRETSLSENKDRIVELQKRIGAPFERTQQLNEAIARAATLRAELLATNIAIPTSDIEALIDRSRWENEGGRVSTEDAARGLPEARQPGAAPELDMGEESEQVTVPVTGRALDFAVTPTLLDSILSKADKEAIAKALKQKEWTFDTAETLSTRYAEWEGNGSPTDIGKDALAAYQIVRSRITGETAPQPVTDEDLAGLHFRQSREGVTVAPGAKDVTIAGAEGMPFYVYQNKDGDWFVNEATVGMSVSGSADTRKQAIDDATSTIAQVGIDKVREVIGKSKQITREQKVAAVEAGLPKLSVGPLTFETGIAAEDVQRVYDHLTQGKSLPLNIIPENAWPVEMRAELKRQIERTVTVGSRVKGAYWNGEVYIDPTAISTKEAALELAKHELTHAGLDRLLPRKALQRTLQAIYDTNPNVKTLADAWMVRMGDKNLHLAVEETLAKMAEKGEWQAVKGWQALWAMVRSALRKIWPNFKFSDADVAALISRAQRAAVEGATGTGAARLAKTGPTWYSALSEAIPKAPWSKDGTMAAPQFKAWLDARTKDGTFKKDEREWTGLDDYLSLQDGKVSRDDVQAFLVANGVRVEEKILGGDEHLLQAAAARINAAGYDIEEWADHFVLQDKKTGEIVYADDVLTPELQKDWDLITQARPEEQSRGQGTAKFGQWQLPGGTGYRELLLTLPAKMVTERAVVSKSPVEVRRSGGGEGVGGYFLVDRYGEWGTQEYQTRAAASAALDDQRAQGPMVTREAPETYRGGHYGDVAPNVLAHVRFNDRTDADGKKVLFIEELQSDWAQRGRKEGFAEPEKVDAARAKVASIEADLEAAQSLAKKYDGDKYYWIGKMDGENFNLRPAAERAEIENKRNEAIKNYTEGVDKINNIMLRLNDARADVGKFAHGHPSAPFVGKTEAWTALALKRMIRYGSEHGYDAISWATGAQQADRYDLSKQIDAIDYRKTGSGGAYKVAASRDGITLFNKEVPESELEGLVGKDIAAKILAGEGNTSPRGTSRSPEKRLSGLDLKVGGEGMRGYYDKIVPSVANDILRKLGANTKVAPIDLYGQNAVEAKTFPNRKYEPDLRGQPSIDITPALRAKAMEGLPLFSRQADMGKVMTLYRGTNAEGNEDFAVRKSDHPIDGISFTKDKETAKYYGDNVRQYKVIARVADLNEIAQKIQDDWFAAHPEAKGMPQMSSAELKAEIERRGYNAVYTPENDEVRVFSPDQIETGRPKQTDTSAFDPESAMQYRVHVAEERLQAFWDRHPGNEARFGNYSAEKKRLEQDLSRARRDLERSTSAPKFSIDVPEDTSALAGMTPQQQSDALRRSPGTIHGPVFDSTRNMWQDIFRSDRVLNRVISKGNTPYHIAETFPEFKPVYQRAQRFNYDVARIVREAADIAKDFLPTIERFSDFGKKLASDIDAKTTHAAAMAGTLFGGGNPLEGRKWTVNELRTGRAVIRDAQGRYTDATMPAGFSPLNDKQIELYNQALASVAHGVEETSKGTVYRLARLKKIVLDQGNSLDQMVAAAKDAADARIEEINTQWAERAETNSAKLKEAERERSTGLAGEAAKAALADEAAVKTEVEELQAFKTAIDDIQTKTDKLITAGYFPASRFGRYGVNVAERDAEGNYKELEFYRFESQFQANRAKRALQAQYVGNENIVITSGPMSVDGYKLFQGLNLDAMSVMIDHLVTDDGKPVNQDPLLQQFIRIAAAERSVLKRQLHRKGILGYSTDITRSLAQFALSSATSASRDYHAAAMLSGVQDIAANDLKDYAARYVKYLQDPNEEMRGIRSFLANYFILGSIASAAVNMTQPLTMSAPALSAHTSWVNAVKELATAMKDIVGGLKNLTPDEQAAYAQMAPSIAPQEIHQIRAEGAASIVEDNLLFNRMAALAKEHGIPVPSRLAVRKASFIWGAPFSLAEQMNRGSTALAAYRIAKAKGIANPVAFAMDMVDSTQGVYNRADRPEMARGPIGSTLMTFKQFTISYIELGIRLAKLPDKRPFAAMVLTLMALAGTAGLPFVDDIEDIIDGIGQWMGFATNTKKSLRKFAVNALGEDLANMAQYGISGIPGVPIDVANRLGFQNVIPGSALLKTSEPDKTASIVQLLGPAAAVLQSGSRAIENIATGKSVLKSLGQAGPTALQNVMQGVDMVETGVYRDRLGRKVMDVDAIDSAFKTMGFQPNKVAQESRILQQEQQDISLHRVIESSIVGKWAQGIVEKDPEMVKDAVAALQDWNKNNPELRIAVTQQQIQSRVKSMLQTREQRFIKAAPPETRAAVAQDLRH